jgi:hypothetical protein
MYAVILQWQFVNAEKGGLVQTARVSELGKYLCTAGQDDVRQFRGQLLNRPDRSLQHDGVDTTFFVYVRFELVCFSKTYQPDIL